VLTRPKTLFLLHGVALLLADPLAIGAAPPQGDAGPDREMMAGDRIILRGTGHDPDGDPIIGWHWEIYGSGEESHAYLTGATAPSPTFTATLAGVYVMTLVISDGVELSEPDFVSVTVAYNKPPVAVPVADQTSGSAPLKVNFNGIESDEPDLQPLTYDWHFGDGHVGKGPKVTHQYSNPGSYLVTLVVADDHGAIDLATLDVVVTEGDTPPAVAAAPAAQSFPDEGLIRENSDVSEGPGAGGGMSPVAAAAVVRDALTAAIQDALENESAAWGNTGTTGAADNDLAALTQRIDNIVASLAALEGKLSDLRMTVESMKLVAKPGARPQVSAPENNKSGTSKTTVKESNTTKSSSAAFSREPVTEARDSGPWVINLASIRDKAGADRFTARIESKGVRVQQCVFRRS